MSPLQEAIAKAEAILSYAARRATERPYMSPEERLAHIEEHAESILDSLGVLRADDDTRYVAITKQQRDRYAAYLAQQPIYTSFAQQELDALVAAYDAVAPNAKDHA